MLISSRNAAIDEDKHERSLQVGMEIKKGQLIPKGVVSFKKLYDLQELFQGPRNSKTHNSNVMNELNNSGTEQDLKFINLNMCCTHHEQQAFVCLFKQYRDVFAWTYDNLKTYETHIIQHIILIKEGVKPSHQKLSKLHPSLKLLIQKELTNLLDATDHIKSSSFYLGFKPCSCT